VLNQGGSTLTASVSDTDSGPASPTVTVDAPANGAVGLRSVSVTATDNAANSTTVSCEYEVVYQFSGFAAPIDNLPKVNSAKAGQAIPVKWRITDANGVGISDPSSFVQLKSAGGACGGGSVGEIEAYAPGSSGLLYLGDGSWQFNWKTDKQWKGHCRTLTLVLADGTTHTAQFQFK
jgi:hypothetical protein